MKENLVWFRHLGMSDVPRVGGKNASLGEMIGALADAGIEVPSGFATTADAYRRFLAHRELDVKINGILDDLDVDDVNALTMAGSKIRQWVEETPFPPDLEQEIRDAYAELSVAGHDAAVAVRSSATAEDLPEASFAGQQESFLNVSGIDDVLRAIKKVFASLFNDRAISYRVHQGFSHADVALSAGIQYMVRSDIGSSGVMFTLDTESGFDQAVFITSSWGLGECVVQGSVNPDEFYVYKPALDAERPAILKRNMGSKLIKMTYAAEGDHPVAVVDTSDDERRRFSLGDEDVVALARMAVVIETHYGRPMDIEWGRDGETGKLYILQARPETVQSRGNGQVLERFELRQRGEVLAEGRAIGQRIGSGVVRIVPDIEHLARVEPGDVLVTDMTDPDWEPVMKRASAIVTNRGGRTCHAAIIARELGVPAVDGCGDATHTIADGAEVTVSCAEGDNGHVYAGKLDFELKKVALDDMPELPFKIMMNVGNPERAFDFAKLPNFGVGLARLEFIINNTIGVHPKAALHYADMPEAIRERIDSACEGYADPVAFYVEKLSEGIATLSAAFAPRPVIIRMSDFKSNEYANMIGGPEFEPDEENPMLGFRGASRYVDDNFRECFELECKALKHVRDDMGLDNLWIMVPFVRTVDEARQVTELLAQNGLERGANGLKVIMMCEIPSNALLAEQFLEYFDGFSIGSNDLTQLTLGLDRDSGVISHLFDERDPAVKMLLSRAIQACRSAGKYIGICGQGPSDHPDLARWLMDEGIESVSLNPDTVVETWMFLAGKSI
ncbi:MAG: phosphoenolpyruvate synthase [Proteobacteria bacterium]|nr:MAG: phosphoenolpyruvate synthase [Pseudomonadota bacterium]